MSSAAMTARAYAAPPPASSMVNELLEGNFRVMSSLPRGQAVTFFRDVTTFETLLAVLVGQTLTMAPLLPSVVAELGPLELAEFSVHFSMLGAYTALAKLLEAAPVAAEPPPRKSGAAVSREELRRACRRDALLFGSGLD